MTIAMAIGTHNLSAVPIILAVIIIGIAVYFMWRRRRKQPQRPRQVTGKLDGILTTSAPRP